MSAFGLRPDQVSVADISTRTIELFQAAGLPSFQLDLSNSVLPFPDQSFDLVIMSEVVEHLVNIDAALREIRRVMRHSGGLILTTPNLAGWLNRLQLLAGRQPIGTETGSEWVFGRGPFVPPSRPVGHLQLFTLPALVDLLRYHRLPPTGIWGLPFSETIPQVKSLHRLDGLFARFPGLASSLLIVAIKDSIGVNRGDGRAR